MTSTIKGIVRTGKTSERQLFAAYLTTATAETETGRRVRGLLSELDEIAQDRQMAGRFVDSGTWLTDLVREERDVWDHIVEALSSGNGKKEEK
ncbi:hypothetical protein [Kutzneria buriramensis]|uniref:Uncharacterized protein n=1 Tax=Kutzneria buriramensis TaxID=1045776 RepID=A0A3E0G7Z2_9PSEU|nr:hypothetical protein [Kutzneria buriramensis]REH18276.1 hypothetical protein BCF44_13631 [Kutzneria buriramensis]